MTKLLTSTALIAMLAGPVLAQTTAAPAAPATTETTTATDAATTTAPATAAPATADAGFGYTATPTDMSAETFIGKRLYAAETDVDTTATYNEIDEGWDDIGEINDLVISDTGDVKAVLVDIGGFLGMGERTVAVAMEQLRVLRDGDSENDYFIVFTANREALENAPEFEWPDRG
ncbi:PRC-barrel domain-containing protein [Paracoccus sp. SSK6]|uniref:PRC-barrel domain-containing protein n=1 Tax=Paracoccus sp. SSK6 TaxID=3143131 RepID=UPI00321B46EC